MIELKSEGDELQTDLSLMEQKIQDVGGPEKVLAIVSTTSCFAPRGADELPQIAEVWLMIKCDVSGDKNCVSMGTLHVFQICKSYGIPHVINNAYGIQSTKCMHLVERCGNICGNQNFTVFVQSTDKNFMVPVGGSVIAGFNKSWLQNISQVYPGELLDVVRSVHRRNCGEYSSKRLSSVVGRASATPTIDLFITLMSMGVKGYKQLVKERTESFRLMKSEMQGLARKFGERVLETKNNPISIGKGMNYFSSFSFPPHAMRYSIITLSMLLTISAMTLCNVLDVNGDGKSISEVGSMLFTRNVSGVRVITGKDVKTIEGHQFKG